MPIQLTVNGSSGKSRYVPGGPTEAVIAFIPEDRTAALQSDVNHTRAADGHNTRATDATLIWYHSLGDTERQIKGLQLHEINEQPPFVTLSMKDDSFLVLQISETRDSVDVIRLTEITPLAPPSIRVDFLQDSDGKGSCVDLKFGIAICQAVLSSRSLINPEPVTRTMMTTPQCRRLFSLALFVSIVRKCLPIDKSLIKDIQSLSYIDDFWLEALSSSQCYSQLLWEESIVGKMHQEIRGWIHTAACQQLQSSILPRTSVPQVRINNEPEPAFEAKEQHIAASITAWLEFSAEKAKTSASESWDVEWDRSWRSEWRKNFKANWNKHKGLSEIFYIRLSDSMPHVPTGNTFSGYAAGRAAIELSLVASVVNVPSQSLLGLDFTTTAPTVSHDVLGASSLHSRGNEYNWLGSWHSARHPDLKQPGKWLPVWEAARNLAWALAWENPEAKPRSSVESSATQYKVSQTGQKLSTRTTLFLLPKPATGKATSQSSQTSLSQLGDNMLQKAESQIQKLAADARGQLFKWFNRDHTETHTEFSRGIAEPNIQELGMAVWCEVSGEAPEDCEPDSLNPRANSYIREQAKNVLNQLKDETSQALHSGIPSEITWETIYTATWRQTWRKSWENAWSKVMHDTADGFEQWRYQAGCCSQGEALAVDIESLDSYNRLKEYLSGGSSSEDNHWRIRSAFKALNLLRKALLHSVPTCYREVMCISYFPDRPFEFLTPNPSAGLQQLAKVIQQDREEYINHSDLQSKIKTLASPKHRPKFPGNYNAIDQLEEIWKMATRIDLNEEFLKGQDLQHNKLWVLATESNQLPLRHNAGKMTWARYQWHKAVDDLRRGVPRRNMSTNSYK
ncbi:unnamed protein product [Rhizoctonia solani]|uniref:Uncharacterized protein n=1 Tax=Rhizoctonia solani TaxID=456999 RepID=A0A8H3H598_9AGAM|nr:unnamed protein product [Rhizoctonia solani]